MKKQTLNGHLDFLNSDEPSFYELSKFNFGKDDPTQGEQPPKSNPPLSKEKDPKMVED